MELLVDFLKEFFGPVGIIIAALVVTIVVLFRFLIASHKQQLKTTGDFHKVSISSVEAFRQTSKQLEIQGESLKEMNDMMRDVNTDVKIIKDRGTNGK